MDTIKIMNELEMKGIHEVDVPTNGISGQGIREVREYVRKLLKSEKYAEKFKELDLHPNTAINSACRMLYEDCDVYIGQEWVTKQGTFPKRFAKGLQKDSRLQALTRGVLARLGLLLQSIASEGINT